MSEKKLSYKPGFALVLWGVLVLTVFVTQIEILRELFPGDGLVVVSTVVVTSMLLIGAGLCQWQVVSSTERYREDLISYAKVNESHLCPDCAKYMNDNKYKISRI